jgi:hypothetical protein
VYGYVFLSYGAKRTLEPERYPARRDQIDNLTSEFEARGITDYKLAFERVPKVEGLQSLPTLIWLLERAAREQSFVVVDHIGRIFYRCPVNLRGRLRGELQPYLPLIREVARECQQASTRTREELRALLRISEPVRFRKTPRMRRERSTDELAHQTAAARAVSANTRARWADTQAKLLQILRGELLETNDRVTYRLLADEANRRGIKTTRGNNWSAATVKRALDRLKQDGDAER